MNFLPASWQFFFTTSWNSPLAKIQRRASFPWEKPRFYKAYVLLLDGVLLLHGLSQSTFYSLDHFRRESYFFYFDFKTLAIFIAAWFIVSSLAVSWILILTFLQDTSVHYKVTKVRVKSYCSGYKKYLGSVVSVIVYTSFRSNRVKFHVTCIFIWLQRYYKNET